MRIESWDAERKRDSAQPQVLRIGQMNSSITQFSIPNSHPRADLLEISNWKLEIGNRISNFQFAISNRVKLALALS
jgi:hypothetical protein